MKKTKTYLIVFLGLLFLLFSLLVKESQALCDNGKTGPNIGNRIDYFRNAVFDGYIRGKYNANNAGCQDGRVSVTILFSFDEAANDTGGFGSVQDILTRMRQENLVPVIRLYTGFTGSGFSALDPDNPSDREIIINAAQNLGTKIQNAGWGSGEVIVSVGNEVNSPAEWPVPPSGIDTGSVNQRLTDFAEVYALFSQNAPSNYRVFLPSLNAYLGSCDIHPDYGQWVQTLVSQVQDNGGRIDGTTFTIYNFDKSGMHSDYNRMAVTFSLNGVNSYTVTELGPKTNDDIGPCRLLDQADDLEQWESVMSSVFQDLGPIGGAEHVNTAFFLNCGGNLSTFMPVIHEDGTVHVEDEGGKITCGLIEPGGNFGLRPLEEGFWMGRFNCGEIAQPDGETPEVFNEFHPLRPYPASACDLLIPKSKPEATQTKNKKYITYACGTSIDYRGDQYFDPYGTEGDYGGEITAADGTSYTLTECVGDDPIPETDTWQATCYRTVKYEITANFRDSNVGILGNTQMTGLKDEQKISNYLSWYFTGTTQIGDRDHLDPNDEDDIYRLVNFSGPIRKLLPWDVWQDIQLVITRDDIVGTDIHNYALNEDETVRLSNFPSSKAVLRRYFPNIPLTSLEDTAGEVFHTAEGFPAFAPINGTAPFRYVIQEAVPAR